jgi:hypothetical protein
MAHLSSVSCLRVAAAGIVFAALLASGCGNRREVASNESDRVPQIDAAIEIVIDGADRSVRFTFEQLAVMPSTRLDNIPMLKSREADESTSWQGPTLAALLAPVEPVSGAFVATLEADDGYQIDVKLSEVDDAIVALKDGRGRWLAEVDKRCYLRLVAPRKTANFWVANLRRIRLKPVPEP